MVGGLGPMRADQPLTILQNCVWGEVMIDGVVQIGA
jgi:hypothetical protein